MSSVATTPATQSDSFHSDRRPLKRKLEDYETPSTSSRENSTFDCKGKSVVDNEFESSSVENIDGYVFQDESSNFNRDFTGSQLQFFVRMISGANLVLRANLKDTVEMVHQKIEKMTGLPVLEQRLIYEGKQLQWEQTLNQCGIENNAGLQLVGRMRSTDHPRVWQLIIDMVSTIYMVCRGFPDVDPCLVNDRMEQFLNLRDDKRKDFAPHNKTRKKRDRKKKKQLDESDENINERDQFKIFMDAGAPQGLIMLYFSKEKQNQECAEHCIRSFLSTVKNLEGSWNGRAYCAIPVLEFCKLLRMKVTEDDLLYIHCRSILGSVLQKVEAGSNYKGVYEDTYAAVVSDGFIFLKEIGEKLVKDLVRSVDSGTRIGPFHQDVCDFSAFLQPLLSFKRRELAAAESSVSAKGKTKLFADDHLFLIFTDLLCWINNCLHKVDLCLALKRENDVEANTIGWSQYLAILKELHSIALLYPGSQERFQTTIREYKTGVCALIVKYAKRYDDNSWLLKHKDALDFESRRHLAMLLFPVVRESYAHLFEMLIDRSNLLGESFSYISGAASSSLHHHLFMKFKNEEATGPGVLREWFCLVCQAIFDPRKALFSPCTSDRQRFFPTPASKVHTQHLQYFQFSGRVVALALKHKIQVGVVLDRVFFLQLAGRHVSIEDIRDADPCIYNSCKQILAMDAAFVDSDALGLTFVSEIEELGTRKIVELCSGGKDIVVNSKNRKEYVDLIVQHRFVTSVAEQVSYFAKGFADILNERKFQETFFESLELEDLDWMLRGSESEICVKDWMSHTQYEGYQESDPQIVWFWEVVGKLNAEQKKTLLFFWTSVKYLPIEGFRGLTSKLLICKSLESEDLLPSSHTCFYELCMPPYPSKDVLQKRLDVITQEHVSCSFGTL